MRLRMMGAPEWRSSEIIPSLIRSVCMYLAGDLHVLDMLCNVH